MIIKKGKIPIKIWTDIMESGAMDLVEILVELKPLAVIKG